MESDCKQGSEAKIELMEQKRLQLSHFESKKKKVNKPHYTYYIKGRNGQNKNEGLTQMLSL